MRIDPAPFIANLFLHYSENRFMKSLIESKDLVKARSLSNFFRYLDDLLGLNDKGLFDQFSNIIYPPELILSRTDSNGVQTDYLDLDIDFDFLGFYNIRLFDKRDGFNFKVINYPCLTYSNVPTSQSYGIYLSQLLRVSRICTCINDFYSAVIKVTNEAMNF